jgi:hypothetical protein
VGFYLCRDKRGSSYYRCMQLAGFQFDVKHPGFDLIGRFGR